MSETNQETQAPMKRNRYEIIDIYRGVAVLLMIIFHFTYDLALFKYVPLTFKKHQDPFWWFLPRIIVFLFMVSMGMSMHLVHFPTIKWKVFSKRVGKLAFFAIIISVSTYYMFPKRWIYFGTLHSIAVCSFLVLPLLRLKYFNLIFGLGLFVHVIVTGKSVPWWILPHPAMDYIPPFPWIGAAALGVFMVKMDWHKWQVPNHILLRGIQYLGKHSLVIYLVHQPLLYGSVFLFYKLMSST